jgi:hypothetical protein
LGVSKVGIKILLENDFIKSKGTKTLHYKSIIDISPVIELFSPHFISNIMKPLSEQKESLIYNNICLSNIFLAVKEDKLNIGFQPSSDLMSSLYCAPDDLKVLIKKKRHHNIQMTISNLGEIEESKLFSDSSRERSLRYKKSNQLGFNF